MRPTLFAFVLCSSFILPSFAQDDAGLVLLARAYKENMFRNEPTKETLKSLERNVPATLATTRDFIVETISPKNDLLDIRFMRLPDETTLRQIHVVRQLDLDMRKEQRIGDQVLMDSLRAHPAERAQLVLTYYSMLFVAVGNKNQPFNMSKLDLRPDDYGLLDDRERGILFLECMDLCRSVIWGYMNVVQPPNTAKAMENIKRFPKLNGSDYYRFDDLLFPDMEFMYDDSLQSYKHVMIDQYMELLIMHLIAMDKEGAKEEAVRDLLLGSAMRNEKLYPYTKTKQRAVLEQIFQKQ